MKYCRYLNTTELVKGLAMECESIPVVGSTIILSAPALSILACWRVGATTANLRSALVIGHPHQPPEVFISLVEHLTIRTIAELSQIHPTFLHVSPLSRNCLRGQQSDAALGSSSTTYPPVKQSTWSMPARFVGDANREKNMLALDRSRYLNVPN